MTGDDHFSDGRTEFGSERSGVWGSQSSCDVCDRPISPDRTRCQEHAERSPEERAAAELDRHRSISHVVVAVVPAVNRYHAVALAASALTLSARREGLPSPLVEASFDLIDDFEEPPRTLSREWGGALPDAVSLTDPPGQRLVERARTTAAETDLPRVYDQTGRVIDDRATIPERTESLTGRQGEEPWVVPAVRYNFEYDGPKTSDDDSLASSNALEHERHVATREQRPVRNDTSRDDGGDGGPDAVPVSQSIVETMTSTSRAEGGVDRHEPEDAELMYATVDTMKTLDTGDGVPREELLTAILDGRDVTEAAAERAVRDALLSGLCYEPEENRLKPI